MQGTSATTSDAEIARNPISLEGCGGMAPLSLSLLLANGPRIDSSSLREIGAIALATNVTVFMNRGT
ncbi:MAG: hypothetical protein HY644_05125 [Acidobacteria bacterium]|nr:hypothetical protein [Acidobacteriota bacterium]